MSVGNTKQGYAIKSPNCGRDKNGKFHCTCGKCNPLSDGRLRTLEIDMQKKIFRVNGVDIGKDTTGFNLEFDAGEWNLEITQHFRFSVFL